MLARLQERAAISADVRRLMLASALAAARPDLARYGSARGASAEPILAIFDGLFERVVIGLPGACASLDDDAAERMANAIGKVQESITLLDRPEAKSIWLDALAVVAERDLAAPLVRGLAARVLHEQRRLDMERLLTLASRSLSRAVPPAEAAAWIEGLLRGSAALLLHARDLWSVLDAWLAALDPTLFEEMLPPLRRAFASFAPPERRSMGELVRGCSRVSTEVPRRAAHVHGDTDLDQERADKVMPVLAHILGVTTS